MAKFNIFFCVCLFGVFILTITEEYEYCDGVKCGPGEICKVAICTPMCLDGGPCPHLPCGAYCVPAPVTTEKVTEEYEYCDGVKCGPGEICKVATCTPMCLDGGPCPHLPCGAYCVPAPVTTEKDSQKLCDGQICSDKEVCQQMYCTPYCLDSDKPCPRDPCAKMCVPIEVGTSTIKPTTATP